MPDLPDFLTDIRPRYGATKRAQGVKNAQPGFFDPCVVIAGKGVTVGGFVKLFPIVSHKDDFLNLVVDGASLLSSSFGELNTLGITLPGNSPFWVPSFDDTLFRYCCCIAPGITFEHSLQLQYYNAEPAATLVTYWLYYALI